MSSLYPFLLLYLAAGVITLLIESRSPFRQWLRDRRDPDNLMALIEARDPRSKTLWYRVRARVLAPGAGRDRDGAAVARHLVVAISALAERPRTSTIP
jgi:hypothetical protein